MGDFQSRLRPTHFVSRDYVLGGIYLWYGSIASIPGTFRLCDGTLRTPDLRNKFVVGSGDTYAVGNTGGTINHNHPFTGDGHIHNIATNSEIGAGNPVTPIVLSAAAVGTTDNADKRPPYHSLAYIMYAGRIH